jgi:hypothetical protein
MLVVPFANRHSAKLTIASARGIKEAPDFDSVVLAHH